MKKTIGIVVDNYKIKRYKEELTKAEFTEVGEFPFTQVTTTLKVTTEESKIKDIKAICEKLEVEFKKAK